MRKRLSLPLLVLVLGLALHAAVALVHVEYPGYIDGFYQFMGSVRLARGQGFTEVYGWSLIGLQAVVRDVPRPSFTYWQPGPALVAVGPIALAEALAGPLPYTTLFRIAQAPFLLISSLWSVVAYAYARLLRADHYRAVGAGVLALLSGYLGFTETMSPIALYGLVGSTTLLLCGVLACGALPAHRWPWAALAVGAGIGLAHLCRADALLLWIAAGIALLALPPAVRLQAGALALLGYLLIAGPWLVRNLVVTGNPLGMGGQQILWAKDATEWWSYPSVIAPRPLDADFWLAKPIALAQNALLLFLVGLAATLPLIPRLGALWREPLLRPAAGYGLAMWVVLSLVFTSASIKGSVYQSAAALVPGLCAYVAAGLDGTDPFSRFVARLSQIGLRYTPPASAYLLLVVLLQTGAMFGPLLWHGWENDRGNACAPSYASLRELPAGVPALASLPLSAAYANETDRAYLALPYGDVTSLVQAMRDFRAPYAQVDYPRHLPLYNALRRGEGERYGLVVREMLDTPGCPALLVELDEEKLHDSH